MWMFLPSQHLRASGYRPPMEVGATETGRVKTAHQVIATGAVADAERGRDGGEARHGSVRSIQERR